MQLKVVLKTLLFFLIMKNNFSSSLFLYFIRLNEIIKVIIMLRKGLYEIKVNEEVEFELSYYNANKFKKLQYSGFINGDQSEYYYLPTHQALVDELMKIPRGSLVRAKRLTKGGPKEACKYEVKILREGPKPQAQQTLV